MSEPRNFSVGWTAAPLDSTPSPLVVTHVDVANGTITMGFVSHRRFYLRGLRRVLAELLDTV
jgi:hypothetical protein